MSPNLNSTRQTYLRSPKLPNYHIPKNLLPLPFGTLPKLDTSDTNPTEPSTTPETKPTISYTSVELTLNLLNKPQTPTTNPSLHTKAINLTKHPPS